MSKKRHNRVLPFTSFTEIIMFEWIFCCHVDFSPRGRVPKLILPPPKYGSKATESAPGSKDSATHQASDTPKPFVFINLHWTRDRSLSCWIILPGSAWAQSIWSIFTEQNRRYLWTVFPTLRIITQRDVSLDHLLSCYFHTTVHFFEVIKWPLFAKQLNGVRNKFIQGRCNPWSTSPDNMPLSTATNRARQFKKTRRKWNHHLSSHSCS